MISIGALVFASMMCALIWVIQCVHYPSFYFIEKKSFRDFEIFHQKSISFIVIPFMVGDLLFTSIQLYQDKNSIEAWVASILLLIFFLITFLVSAPLHGQLNNGFKKSKIDLLIRTNWIRTIALSAKLFCQVLLTLQIRIH